MPTSSTPTGSASVSGSGSGSGLRRSSRGQINPSPPSVRKSQRLENRRTPPSTTKPTSGPKKKKKKNKNEKCELGDKTLKQIVDEARGSSPKTGDRKRKRMHAMHFKALFDLMNDEGVSETKSKKRKLEFSNDDADSGVGGVDSGILKSEEGLEVKCDEHGDTDDTHVEGLQENGDKEGDGVDEEPSDEPQECSDREEMEEDCATNVDGNVVGVEMNNTSGIDGEVNGSMVGKILNKDIQLGSEMPDDNVHSSSCSHEALTNGTLVAEGEGTHTGSSTEQCAEILDKARRDHDPPRQEPSGNVSNSTSDANFSVSKDRGECSNARVDVHQKTNRRDSFVDTNQNSRVSCKRGGNLLRCSGKACARNYHPCLRTLEENAYIPIWYCSDCMKKRLALGVHTVSEGIESVLDAREVELPNSEGLHTERQYFVKYKCLAHIHNCWIAETQLCYEAPELLIRHSEQGTSWNSEWAVPHRLLLRRPVIVDTQDAGFTSKSHHEWLVKWRGLDYDQATWELEDSEFFKKPEVQQLMQEYETRHGAKSSYISGDNKIQERKKISHVKHGKVLDSYRAESVSKLREYYQKSHNAVLFDEQDRTMKIIHFILSIMSNVHRPFLIITPLESLSYWEAEFLRFTTSINVVVYSGSADSRKIIRSLEFRGEDDELMFQVLLFDVGAIFQDLEDIKGLDWELIIVDDCQENCILENSGYIKTLASTTTWQLLLLNAQLKDNVAEYIKILSLLEPVDNSNSCHGIMNAPNEDINLLKERLCSFIISPRFQEYWVPVEISNIQLEQYCFMLSNSPVLRMCSKSDPVGSLHDILISMQKCCDHPYIVNSSLRISLLPENPSQDAALDMGLKASSKLQLLDKLLSEFRNQGLKVVILFQSIGGSGKDNLEFLLDDLLTWRFGKDSFEHIAVGGLPSKKHAVLSKFNRESNRSFLLLERRACLPSIKLSLVDSVIIFNSDWNPLNDLRALQKIVIDSKHKPIKVFRFYCSSTVEEKSLMMAKNDTILDSSVPINPSIKRTLLMWGSAYLFSRLNEFHHGKALNYKDKVAFGSLFVTNVFQEILSLIKNSGIIVPIKYVSEARLDGRCYLKNILLFGEQRNQAEDGVSSHTYWMKLLERKQPQWQYLSVSSERNRKRVDYSDDLALPPDVETDDPVKKQKDSSPRQAAQPPEKVKDRNNEHQGHPDTKLPAQDEISDLHDQKGLFEMLKPTVLRLCETLMLKDEVKRLAERFLEYVLNNHKVTTQPETILQAFQISVCWTAAEVVLEKKVDQRKSLDIAIEKMDFMCLEQEADSVYSKLKLLMKIYLFRNLKSLKSSIDPSSSIDDGTSVLNKSSLNMFNNSLESSHDKSPFENKEKDSLGDIDKVQKICEKKIKKLKERQNHELLKFENAWQEKRAELEDNYKVESSSIRDLHANSDAIIEKLKILEGKFTKKREDLESLICNRRKEFEARQQEDRDGEQKKIAQLLELLKPMAHDEQPKNISSGTHMPTLLPCDVVKPLNGDDDFHLSGKRAGSEEVSLSAAVAVSADDTNQMDTVLVAKERSSDDDNGVSTSLCCGTTEQSVSTFMEPQSADGTSCQVEGAAQQILLPEICSTTQGGETSLFEPPISIPSNLPHDEGTTSLPASSGRVNNQLNEVQMAVQNSCTQNQQQTPPYLGVVRASTSRASHPTQVPLPAPTISRAPPSYHPDPLQNEFDQIRMQIGQTINAHEETKIRLKSECDKEIEEAVAQIRKKYHGKLEEAESSFSLKKNELELHQNMVMMNKFLADAFRSKCMDYKAGGSQGGLEKGTSFSSIEHPSQLQPTTRPPSATAAFSVVQPAGIPNSNPPYPVLGVPIRPHLMRCSSGGSQQVRHAPHPYFQHSPAPHAMTSNNKHYSNVSPLQPPTNNHHLASFSSQPPAFQSTHGRFRQPETFAMLPALSMSATELLMDIARRNDINIRRLSENLPPCPENMEDTVGQHQPAGDVVCLSDDD